MLSSNKPVLYALWNWPDYDQEKAKDTRTRYCQADNSKAFKAELENKVLEGFDALELWLTYLMGNYAERCFDESGKVNFGIFNIGNVEDYKDWIKTTRMICKDYPDIVNWLDNYEAERLANIKFVGCNWSGICGHIDSATDWENINPVSIEPFQAYQELTERINHHHSRMADTLAGIVPEYDRGSTITHEPDYYLNMDSPAYIDDVGVLMIQYEVVILSDTRKRLDSRLQMSPEVEALATALSAMSGDVEKMPIHYIGLDLVRDKLKQWLEMFSEYNTIQASTITDSRTINKEEFRKMFKPNFFGQKDSNGTPLFDKLAHQIEARIAGIASPGKELGRIAHVLLNSKYTQEYYRGIDKAHRTGNKRAFKNILATLCHCCNVEAPEKMSPSRFLDSKDVEPKLRDDFSYMCINSFMR